MDHILSRTSRLRGSAAILLAMVGALWLLPAQPASAHAYLTESNPADASALSQAPRQLSLGFSESIVLGASSLELVDGDGKPFTPTHLRILASVPKSGAEQPVSLLADLPPLPPNAYRLSWQTLSRDDLHRTNGVIAFGIRQQVRAAGQTEPTPRPSEAALRWVLFAGFALGVGGLLAHRLYRDVGSAAALPRRASRLALLGCGVSVTTAVLLLITQVHSAGASVSEVLSGRYGIGWLARQIGLLTLMVIAARISRPPRRAGRAVASLTSPGASLTMPGASLTAPAAAGVVAVATGNALVGHGGAGGVIRVAADAAHLAGAAVWFGGLACLLLAGLPALRIPAGRATVVSAFIAFGRPAAISAAALVASGVYLVSGVAASADALLQTLYGRVLLLKVGLVGLALLLGLANHRYLRRGSASRVVRTIVGEASVGLVIFALAAVLTSSQPALEPQFVRPAAASATPFLDGPAADLQQTMSVRPNQPGRNLVLLEIFNTRRPAPGPIVDLAVSLRDSTGRLGATVTAQRLSDTRWSVPVTLASPGSIELQVTVRRTGLSDVTSRFRWSVRDPASTQRPTLLSNAPFNPPLAIVGLTLMLGTVLMAAFLVLRRRRERRGLASMPSSQWSAPVRSPSEVDHKAASAELVDVGAGRTDYQGLGSPPPW